jgi:hypothetical protein
VSFIDDAKEIDAKLRFRVLQLLNEARSSEAGVRGTRLRSWVEDIDVSFADDDHCLSLLADLQGAGYLTIADQRVHAHERWGLSKIDCRITAKGTRFLAGEEPVDGLIADGRIKKKV